MRTSLLSSYPTATAVDIHTLNPKATHLCSLLDLAKH